MYYREDYQQTIFEIEEYVGEEITYDPNFHRSPNDETNCPRYEDMRLNPYEN